MDERRIFGPPGTGKTTTVIREIAAAVERYGPFGVLACSFTKAATAELTGRAPEIQPATLHSLCWQALGGPAIAENDIPRWNKLQPEHRLSPIEVDGDDALAVDEVRKTRADRLLSEYQRYRGLLIPRAEMPLKLRRFGEAWERWKRVQGLLDFTDLIERTYQQAPIAPGNRRVGFFDEAQDFTPLQLAVIRQWGLSMEWYVLSFDDDQCIYRFAGANPKALLEPPVPEEQKTILTQSYRVPRAVHAFAQRWISQVSYREPKAYLPRDYEGEVRRLPSATYKHPEVLIRDLERRYLAGKTVMILATCTYMLEPTIAVLRKAGIPFHNPYREAMGKWNPLASVQKEISGILAYLGVEGGGERVRTGSELKAVLALLDTDRLLQPEALPVVKQLKDNQIITSDDLHNWLRPEAVIAFVTPSLAWLTSALSQSKRKRLTYPLAVANRFGASQLRSLPRVCVGTIHSVKGGEADVVYLFPDLSRTAMTASLQSREELDAARRVFYVGMTRARETLVICGPCGPSAVQV